MVRIRRGYGTTGDEMFKSNWETVKGSNARACLRRGERVEDTSKAPPRKPTLQVRSEQALAAATGGSQKPHGKASCGLAEA
jgi:hypothetical protein